MDTQTTNLFDQASWDEGYEKQTFELPPTHDHIRLWMNRWAPKTLGRCIEIGCFPGHYLALMGEAGFELNGIDLTPKVDTEMQNWLKSKKYKIGKITRGDFFNFSDSQNFQLVYSNGFIEHFSNWPEVIDQHAKLVAPGGTILISAPNFKGFVQKALHILVDNENYKKHYIPSMDPYKWAERLKKNGFEIHYSGFFGGFDFWNGKQERNIIQKALLLGIRLTLPLLRPLAFFNSKIFSPYFGVAAIKK
jgi:SAM-dependent methyltransferase